MPDIINEGVPSCAITTLGFDGSQWRVEKLPSVAHLGPSAAVPDS
jgi:hypothetical protein